MRQLLSWLGWQRIESLRLMKESGEAGDWRRAADLEQEAITYEAVIAQIRKLLKEGNENV